MSKKPMDYYLSLQTEYDGPEVTEDIFKWALSLSPEEREVQIKKYKEEAARIKEERKNSSRDKQN